MGTKLDIDPGEVKALQHSLIGELKEEIDGASDMLRRRDTCRRLQQTVGRNPHAGAALTPELLTLLDAERAQDATASVDRMFGSEAHSSACRESLLAALSLVNPADAATQLDDAGYSDSEIVSLIVDAASGERVPVQRAGIQALDAIGWLLPDAIGANAGQVASLIIKRASSADTVSLTELRLLRMLVGLQPGIVTEHDQLATILATQQGKDSNRRVLLTDCIVMAAEDLDLSPVNDAFLTDDSVTAILRKTVVETDGLTQLEIAEVLGYEVTCGDSLSGDIKGVERVRRARRGERAGAAELLGAIGALLQTHGTDFVSAQAERVAESEGSALLREAQLYGLAMLAGELPGILNALAERYLEEIPTHRQDRASKSIVVGAALAGHMAPKRVIQSLLDICRQTSGFDRSVAADALGVLHCVHEQTPDPPASLHEAFQQAAPGGTRQMNLANACGYTVMLDHYTDGDGPYEALIDRVYRAATFHDKLNSGMVEPTAVALGLLVVHGNHDVDNTLATLRQQFEQREGIARQQAALAIGYYVAADAKENKNGIRALAKYVSEHIGTDRGAAAKALGFTLALSNIEITNPILELLCGCIRNTEPTEFESVRDESIIDPAQVDMNVGKAATLLGEVAVTEYAPSYSLLAQAADLTTIADDLTQKSATTVWYRLMEAQHRQKGLVQELKSLVQQGGGIGKVADGIASVGDVRPSRDPLSELARPWKEEPIIRRIAAETLAKLVKTNPELTPKILDTVFPSIDTGTNNGDGNRPVRELLNNGDPASQFHLMILNQAHQTHPNLLPSLYEDIRTVLPRSDCDIETRLNMVDILARADQ